MRSPWGKCLSPLYDFIVFIFSLVLLVYIQVPKPIYDI